MNFLIKRIIIIIKTCPNYNESMQKSCKKNILYWSYIAYYIYRENKKERGKERERERDDL